MSAETRKADLQRKLAAAVRRPIMLIRVRRASGRLAEDAARTDELVHQVETAASALNFDALSHADADTLIAFARAGSRPVELLDEVLNEVHADSACDHFDELARSLALLRSEVDDLNGLIPSEASS